MVYIEDVIDYIDLDTSSISNSKNLTAKSPNNAYDLLFDDFSLRPNESLIIKYS
ncbi:MAG: hypothetical protein LBQ24_06650 [Candidatus Peribacteria bacterium]|jgi:hypothetical protein|nr:hypothetical protein [Candidatus Peribacteria bacterium]